MAMVEAEAPAPGESRRQTATPLIYGRARLPSTLPKVATPFSAWWPPRSAATRSRCCRQFSFRDFLVGDTTAEGPAARSRGMVCARRVPPTSRSGAHAPCCRTTRPASPTPRSGVTILPREARLPAAIMPWFRRRRCAWTCRAARCGWRHGRGGREWRRRGWDR